MSESTTPVTTPSVATEAPAKRVRKPLTEEQKERKREKDKTRILSLRAKKQAEAMPVEAPVEQQPAASAVQAPPVIGTMNLVVVEESKPDGTPIPVAVHATSTLERVIELGYSLALSDLAAAKGMTPQDIATFSEHVTAAGIPYPVPPHILRRAHELYRNSADGMLWRCDGRRVNEVVKEVTLNEAQEIVQASRKAPSVRKPQPPKQEKEEKAPASASPFKARQTLFGFAATAIIRWLGKKGIDLAYAKKVLERNGLTDLSDSTIKIQLRAGAKGERGEPAPLTEEQAAQLLKD